MKDLTAGMTCYKYLPYRLTIARQPTTFLFPYIWDSFCFPWRRSDYTTKTNGSFQILDSTSGFLHFYALKKLFFNASLIWALRNLLRWLSKFLQFHIFSISFLQLSLKILTLIIDGKIRIKKLCLFNLDQRHVSLLVPI